MPLGKDRQARALTGLEGTVSLGPGESLQQSGAKTYEFDWFNWAMMMMMIMRLQGIPTITGRRLSLVEMI